MPAQQGVLRWPAEGGARAALAEEDELPFLDATFDRVVMVHALEASEQLPALLAEVWRILVGNGRLLVIVPNRHGLWARSDRTPFGQGHPYTTRNWPACYIAIASRPTKAARRCSVRRRRRADGSARAKPGKKSAPAGSRASPV